MSKRWDPSRYAEHGRFVPELGRPVVERLDPRPGERILDLGCGDGVLTEAIVARGAVVVGVDASAEQIEAARGRGLDARVIDAAALPFDGEFDAVFSNAALHWMRDPDAVLAGVHRALRPGGRFIAEMGGEGNVHAIHSALGEVLAERGIDIQSLSPPYFPSAEEYGSRLESHGFRVEEIRLSPRPTPLPGPLSGWLETFADWALAAAGPSDRPKIVEETCRRLQPVLCDAEGRWTADYVRLRFGAVRPARGARPAPARRFRTP